MTETPVPREHPSSGLQERVWDRPQLTWAQRGLWVWFGAYVVMLVWAARQVAERVGGGWLGFGAMVGCVALGMFPWRHSLVQRVRTMSTILGGWCLRLAYLTIFAPWAWLIQRRDPMQLRRHDGSGWTNRPTDGVKLTDGLKQY